ncbi:MAG: UDP-N-acetylglucosamine 1-carboxyvinyltransferase [Parcubacteria group bacterium GW2011_GWA1_47_11]|uniref:UDP-N-acetylglucosamine 1-carboxyvinyltransferase n=1 Tax=Candidatus Colwellbacteria bacterium GWA2_46_10 TaxID=1797684 RepID=A0A1G1YZM5_9BACT|nr:MAG: UDP-N-acetylglucosamine 1-carboxyvinyltransferase [Parcubacteria group bacterium GW2011_GWA1_47_11]OGY56867.1 MAG: UDP-N-acetylglucosamine 1-carboxyvinyltransferase [Candidatus Colwellbacteria bacterium GWA2_46_10]
MKFVVNGGKSLKGEIRVSGSKNATTPILAATLLTSRPCVISNIPLINDVLTIIELLEHIGSKVEWLDKRTVRITNDHIDASHLSRDMVRRLRSAILFIGPLLARFGKVKINTPGGCHIGVRPMDAHFNAFKDLGFKVTYNEATDLYSIVRSSKQKLTDITLGEFSVTATENLLMYGALHTPLTIKVAAAEPHVQDLGKFLQELGADIEGLGTHEIKIKGKVSSNGKEVRHHVVSDYIEAGTFLVLGAVTKSDITVVDVPVKDLVLPIQKLKEFGLKMEIKGNRVKVLGSKSKLQAVGKIKTGPYPDFPTDLQAPFGVLATQAAGATMIFESMYEGRLKYLYELDKMGASIDILDPHRARIKGPKHLVGKNVESIDLRAGVTLLLAALTAKGESTLHQVEQIDRGYEAIEERIQKIGADIKRLQ